MPLSRGCPRLSRRGACGSPCRGFRAAAALLSRCTTARLRSLPGKAPRCRRAQHHAPHSRAPAAGAPQKACRPGGEGGRMHADEHCTRAHTHYALLQKTSGAACVQPAPSPCHPAVAAPASRASSACTHPYTTNAAPPLLHRSSCARRPSVRTRASRRRPSTHPCAPCSRRHETPRWLGCGPLAATPLPRASPRRAAPLAPARGAPEKPAWTASKGGPGRQWQGGWSEEHAASWEVKLGGAAAGAATGVQGWDEGGWRGLPARAAPAVPPALWQAAGGACRQAARGSSLAAMVGELPRGGRALALACMVWSIHGRYRCTWVYTPGVLLAQPMPQETTPHSTSSPGLPAGLRANRAPPLSPWQVSRPSRGNPAHARGGCKGALL